MALSTNLMFQFAKAVSNKKTTKESTINGTVVEYAGGKYVQLDGSDQYTPVTSTADYDVGERVTILIKNHTATVTGNITSPSVSGHTANNIRNDLSEVRRELSGENVNIKEQLDALSSKTIDLETDNAEMREQAVEQLSKINELDAANKTMSEEINELDAANNTIKEQIAVQSVKINQLESNLQKAIKRIEDLENAMQQPNS